MLTQNILTQPTFDLIDWSILSYNSTDQILFCQSNQVFKFDKCKGTITPLSRILREDCQESKFVKNVISATIDAGFVGKLVFKIELNNNNRTERMEENENYGTENQILRCFLDFQKEIQNSVQIDLNPFPNNYYSGTNQKELEPDVFFTSGNSSKSTVKITNFMSKEPTKQSKGKKLALEIMSKYSGAEFGKFKAKITNAKNEQIEKDYNEQMDFKNSNLKFE